MYQGCLASTFSLPLGKFLHLLTYIDFGSFILYGSPFTCTYTGSLLESFYSKEIIKGPSPWPIFQAK